jgi:hypothetical protein
MKMTGSHQKRTKTLGQGLGGHGTSYNNTESNMPVPPSICTSAESKSGSNSDTLENGKMASEPSKSLLDNRKSSERISKPTVTSAEDSVPNISRQPSVSTKKANQANPAPDERSVHSQKSHTTTRKTDASVLDMDASRWNNEFASSSKSAAFRSILLEAFASRKGAMKRIMQRTSDSDDVVCTKESEENGDNYSHVTEATGIRHNGTISYNREGW